jgi:hypothetical protein
MNKLDNYIFLSIAEISYECFKKTKFMTYTGYCNTLNHSLKSGIFSNQERNDLMKIITYLEKIYSLSKDETNRYILTFFEHGDHAMFGRCVKETLEFFDKSFN